MSVKVVEIGVEFEVAIGQAAMDAATVADLEVGRVEPQIRCIS